MNSERGKDSDSADPDEKSWIQSEAEETSGSGETNEQSPSHVRSNFNSKLLVFIAFTLLLCLNFFYLCIIDVEDNNMRLYKLMSGFVFLED